MNKVKSYKINHELADEIIINYHYEEVYFIYFFFNGDPVDIEYIEEFETNIGLDGELTIKLPEGEALVYSYISNERITMFLKKYEGKMKLNEKLKELRENLGITKTRAAEELKLHRSSIYRMEKGTRKLFDVELCVLLDLYGITADEIGEYLEKYDGEFLKTQDFYFDKLESGRGK